MKVRILLSNAFLDPKDPRDNTHTVAYVNDIARREKLDMEARILNGDLTELDKIHNKGIIVDSLKVFISSVNWSQNSPANNREVGLIVEHPTIGAYYTDIFTYDWYNGTPANHPLIVEVDAGGKFVELVHFGTAAVDVGAWTLQSSSGSWALPAKTLLAPGRPLVVTPDLKLFREKFGPTVEAVELPGLRFSPDRDTLRLRRSSTTVDTLAWGESEPGWKLPGPGRVPLCRTTPGKDTNTLLDWAAGARPTPGVAGCGR